MVNAALSAAKERKHVNVIKRKISTVRSNAEGVTSNLIAFLTVVSIMISFWLNKLGVFVASKLLIDRGQEIKMTSVDIYFLIFGVVLLLAWFCSTVLGLALPEFIDKLWMPDSWRSDYETYWLQ